MRPIDLKDLLLQLDSNYFEGFYTDIVRPPLESLDLLEVSNNETFN